MATQLIQSRSLFFISVQWYRSASPDSTKELPMMTPVITSTIIFHLSVKLSGKNILFSLSTVANVLILSCSWLARYKAVNDKCFWTQYSSIGVRLPILENNYDDLDEQHQFYCTVNFSLQWYRSALADIGKEMKMTATIILIEFNAQILKTVTSKIIERIAILQWLFTLGTVGLQCRDELLNFSLLC